MTAEQRIHLDRQTKQTATGQTNHRRLKISSILVATDLSARSDRAIHRAFALADQLKARLTIVHVFDDDLPASAHDRISSAARAEIESMLSRLDPSSGIEPTISILAGTTEQDILSTADAVDADLIVMGVHRNETGSRPLTGTTLERVIRKGVWPVLVVKNPVGEDYGSALIATDFSVHSRLGLRLAASVAPESALHVIHSYHVPFLGLYPDKAIREEARATHEAQLGAFIEEELTALIDSSLPAKEDFPALHAKAKAGDVRSVVRQEVQGLQPDLLVLGTHGRTGVANLVLGSIAADFLNQPPCDVLAVKAW